MKLRSLGLYAMFVAPCLFLNLLMGAEDAPHSSTLNAVFDIVYISGWMCSIVGLWRMEAMGSTRLGKLVLLLQLLFLSLTTVVSIMNLLQLGIGTKIFSILDSFWSISNLWMIPTGLAVLTANRLQGWMKFMPLIVGLWLPVSLFYFGLFLGGTERSVLLTGVYSATAWTLLGFVVYRHNVKPAFSNTYVLS